MAGFWDDQEEFKKKYDIYEIFCLTNEQRDMLIRWDKCANKNHGAIGGHLTFEFTPTSIGVIIIAKCSSCGKEICLENLS